jgi:hypothetical protein
MNEIWDKLKTPPPWALKKIQAGRLRGKTDINPQWRYKAMTDIFGICGIGWKYTIDKLWLEPASKEQVMAFCQVSLYIKQDDIWSDAIHGIGGSMAISLEKDVELHTSDECYKMATTDALSVAMKMIGVGAEIYQGTFDSKYAEAEKENKEQKSKEAVARISKLPEDVKDGLRLLGYNALTADAFCVKFNYEPERIKKETNIILDMKKVTK